MFPPIESPLLSDADLELIKERQNQIQSLSAASLEVLNCDSAPQNKKPNGSSGGHLVPDAAIATKPKVFHRIRPLNENETPSSSQPSRSKYKFEAVFPPTSTNAEVYASTLLPHIDLIKRGGNVIFFAYGHTGTGKTHSTLGYGSEDGLYTLAARQLQKELPPGCLLGVRCAEIHLERVYDLVDGRTECTLREDGKGNLHVRAKPVKEEGTGKVYATGQKVTICGPEEDILRPLTQAIASRAVGSSSLHDTSSRSHCVVQVEVVSEDLIRARAELEDAEAALHPVGSAKDTAEIRIAELLVFGDSGMIRLTCDDGSESGEEWMVRYDKITTEIIEKYREFTPLVTLVAEKRRQVETIIAEGPSCLTGILTLCDLAGSDYDKRDLKDTTPQQRKESQMINKDLLALKECFRGLAKGLRTLPFRRSKLTRMLKPAFGVDGKGAQAIMLCTTAPSAELEAHTIGTLRYGQLFA